MIECKLANAESGRPLLGPQRFNGPGVTDRDRRCGRAAAAARPNSVDLELHWQIGSGQRRSEHVKSLALQSTSRSPGEAEACNSNHSVHAPGSMCAGISCSFFPHPYLSSFHQKFLLMNQAYLLLIYVISDLFLLVSIPRSLKCC